MDTILNWCYYPIIQVLARQRYVPHRLRNGASPIVIYSADCSRFGMDVIELNTSDYIITKLSRRKLGEESLFLVLLARLV